MDVEYRECPTCGGRVIVGCATNMGDVGWCPTCHCAVVWSTEPYEAGGELIDLSKYFEPGEGC